MSLKIKHLNADTSWLLIFSPPFAGHNVGGGFPGSFTVLIDPWLSGPSKVFNSKFALTHHTVPSCVESLDDLPQPNLVIVSQDKTDHCHEKTLKQLYPDSDTLIVGTPAAAKKIKSWKHFDPNTVRSLKRFDSKRNDTLLRIPIPAFSPHGSPGEVTIALLANKIDLAGLHNAIGITYRAPSSVLSSQSESFYDLPMTPPASEPGSPTSIPSSVPSSLSIKRPSTPASAVTTLYPAPYGNREKSLSVIYSPHGCSYDLIKPYASTHLLVEAALPLTALFHSWNRVTNPWYLGGRICDGYPTGVDIALYLFAQVWISAHDEEKDAKGLSVKNTKLERFDMEQIKQGLDTLVGGTGKTKRHSRTAIMQLAVGEEHLIPAK